MTWAMVAVAGAGLVGGVISSNAASDATSQQVGAANNATASQQAMFDKTVQLEQPYNNAGVGATQKLSYLLGLSPQQGGGGAPQVQPAAQPGQTTYSMPSSFPQQWTGFGGVDNSWQSASDLTSASDPNWHPPTYYNPNYNPNDSNTYKGIPVTAFTKPQDAGVAQQATGFNPSAQAVVPTGGMAGAVGGGANDPGFGSLLKPFDMNDFQMDPGTQFRIKYGQQALQNSQAAQNGVMSGSALKDLIGFNQDYAGLGYQSAFDRYMANKSFTLGSLNDLANRGQAAAGNTVNSAGQFSSGIANTITGAGNAAAAGTVGSANAISGGLSTAGSAYMLRNMLGGGGTGGAQGALSNTSVGGSGFGTGLAYGNQDMGQYL